MNVDTFLGNFATVVNSPKGLDQVRSLILRLAIQGRLVPPGREDASELLRELREIRNVATSKKKRGAAALPTRVPDELGFQIPQHWCWTQFGELGDWGAGATPNRADKSYYGGKMPWYKSGELNDGVLGTAEEFITEKALSACSLRINEPGDVLVAMYGATIGKVGIASVQCTTNQAVCACTPFEGVFNRYLLILLKALKPWFIANAAGAAQPNYSKDKIIRTSAPLPPLEEQKRIVAKVDELMRLCDRLEAQQQEREKLLPLLSHANHSRFVAEPTEANLRAVFPAERRSSPSCLRETVLSLAVKGLLVRQDETDQPTDQLMRDILSHIQASDVRQASRLAKKVQDVETTPFPVPESWKWIRLGAISESIEYGTSHKADSNASNVPVYRMGDIQDGELRNDNLKYVPRELDDLPSLFLQPGDILFNRTNSADLVGKAGIFRGPPDKYTFASYLIRVRLPKEFVNPDYINLCFLSPYFRATQIAPELTQQCGQANFNGTKLANTLFPLPPKSEQVRIVLKVKALLEILSRLEAMQLNAKQVASDFATTTVALLTGMSNAETKQMKPPKTEVVTALKVGKKPKKHDAAPLATLLSEQKAEASAKTLWQLSGLEIDAFYRQLKTEMANGWIDEDKNKRAVQEVEVR